MDIVRVISAKHGKDDEIFFELEIDAGEFGKEIVPNCYRANNPYAGEDERYLAEWISSNSDAIAPYMEETLRPEEIRAQIPALTSRQFWMAAAHVGEDGLDKDAIITVIKAQLPDSVDRKMMIAELEASSFERLNPTILDVMELLEIPVEQVDALWMWAAGL